MDMAHVGKFILALLLLFNLSAAELIAPSSERSHNTFAANLFKVIASVNPEENVIYSPASIQSCLTLTFIGAEGQTADEMRSALKLGAGDKTQIGKDYGDFLSSEFKASSQPDDPTLRMANRIYVHKDYTIVPKFNEISREHFGSETEQINFADSVAAVERINNWVAEQTENKIEKVLEDSAVDDSTSAVLINAIYFKAKWAILFPLQATQKKDFYLSTGLRKTVDMMSKRAKFYFGRLKDFDAKAIELPYKNSNLSMLIILPNKINGLKALERKLSSIDLNEISTRLKKATVNVQLPKFKIEFDVDLEKPLQKLGMKQVFTDQANLNGLISSSKPQKISKAKHKAYLDVNEAGSEAVAVTVVEIALKSVAFNIKNFNANHPFIFAIRNKKAVFFAGHVARF